MAEVIETAVGEIVVRDGTAAGIRSAKTNFDQLYNVVRYNWWGIQNLANAFQTVGGTIAAGLGSAVKASVNFDQGMKQVSRTAELSGKDLDAMGQALRNMALVKPISVDALTKIAADAGALGITGVANITKFTGTIADLIATTDLTEESAVQLARLGGVLNIQGDQWQQLGSAILFAGVNSAATEKDIVSMSVRLAGSAAAARLSASEVVALSATITSLGSSSQTGATSVMRAFAQITKAAATGTPNLAEFAKVAGYDGPKAAEQFATSFNKDAGVALAQFVTGLGKMRGNTIATNKVLIDLGFNSQRGAGTLLQLAAGTRQTANKMLDLNKSIKMVGDAWVRNTELTKQANQIYGSTQNQLKMTENAVHDIAIGFGDVLLPALNAVLKPIADLVWGFDQLPEGVKVAIVILSTFVAGLTLAIGAALIFGQRIMLMLGAGKEFVATMRDVNANVLQTVTALRMTSEAEGEYANVTAFSAGKISAAKKEQAVAIYQAWNAAIREDVQRTTSIRLAEVYATRETQLAIAKSEAMRASYLEAEAETALAEAQALAEKGMLDEAAAAQENAIAKARSAQAAEANAAMAADEAAASLVAAAGIRQEGAAALTTAEELIALEASEEGAAGASYALGTALDAATGPFAIVFLAITAATAALTIFGSKHRDAAHDAQALQQADMQLTGAIRASKGPMGEAIQQFYEQNAAFLALKGSLTQYGYTWNQVMSIVTGNSGQAAVDKTLADLDARIAKGDKNAASAKVSLIQLIQQHNAAVVAANAQAEAEDKNKKSTSSMGDASSTAADKLSKLKQAHDAINQAVLDLPEAMFAVRDAEFAVQDAQDALNAALNAGAQHARDLRKAEDDLRQSHIDARAAAEDVKSAEQVLATAREDAANRFKDAQDKVKDDENGLIDSHQKIRDLEQKIADIRKGPSADELRDATNKLADANIRLLNSQKKVQDSQYMLNYLMAEGASNRDITDAQDNLAAAQQDVKDNTDSVIDAQKDLHDVQNPKTSKELAAAERDLATAERGLAAQQRQLKKDQEALTLARKDRSGDTAYRDALDKLHSAQIRLREANMRTKDSEDALHATQRDNPADEVAQKELALQEALYNLAKAHVRVTKDTALMHGEQFGAGREARTLADALGAMATRADGPVKAKLLSLMGVLRHATSDIKDASDAAGGSFGGTGGGGGGDPGGGNEPIINLPDDSAGVTAQSWLDKFKSYMHDHAKDIAATLLMVIGLGAAIAATLLGGEVLLFAAAVIAIIVGFLVKEGPTIGHALSKAFSAAFDFLTNDLPKFVMRVIHGIGHWFQDNATELAIGLAAGLAAAFLIVTLGVPGLMIALGLALIGALVKIITEHWHEITDFFTKKIPEKVASAAKAVGRFATGVGKDIKRGFDVAVHEVTHFFSTTVPDKVTAGVNAVGRFATSIGTHVKNGIATAARHVEHFVTHTVPDFFGRIPGAVTGAFKGLGHTLANLLDGAVNAVIGPWNSAMDWIARQTLTIDLPNWIPGLPDSWSMGFGFFDKLKIPKMAEGGVATQATLAMIGEAGDEAILPLDTLAHMFAPIDTLATHMAANTAALQQLVALQQIGGHAPAGDTYHFHEVMADPVDIAREVVWTKKVRMR